LYGSTQFIREHNSEDSDFARFGLDPHFVATIPEWYSQYVAPSDGSTMEPMPPLWTFFVISWPLLLLLPGTLQPKHAISGPGPALQAK